MGKTKKCDDCGSNISVKKVWFSDETSKWSKFWCEKWEFNDDRECNGVWQDICYPVEPSDITHWMRFPNPPEEK